jgi:uncharacterized iron-regulated membrane protein
MLRLPQRETKLLVGIHGWSGVVLGLLLYAVVLTGTIAVFADEIGHWSVGGDRHRPPFNGPVHSIVAEQAGTVAPEYREDVSLWASTTGNLVAFFHKHGTDESGNLVEQGVSVHVDPETKRVVHRAEGTLEEVLAQDADSALSRFLVDTHVRLYLPNPWGLLLTGILGMAMLVAAISGLLMHRHLLVDIFTLRRGHNRLLVARDSHSVAASWGLPFAFLLAFTGTFFSIAGSFGLPALAMVAFGGDQKAMLAVIVGEPAVENATPTAPGNLDAMLADARRRTGVEPVFVSVAHYGRADAMVNVFHNPAEGQLELQTLEYHGATGDYIRNKPSAGTVPSAGSSLLAILGPVHFGNFAGVLSKSVWVGLGFATCFVLVTGLQLWLKRRAGNPRWRIFERLTVVTAYGLPIALLASAYAFFAAYPAGDPVTWTPLGFVIAAGVIVLAGLLVAEPTRLGAGLAWIAALGLVGLPVARMAFGGPGWAEAMAAGKTEVVAVDLCMLIGGLCGLWFARSATRPLPAARMGATFSEGPAE